MNDDLTLLRQFLAENSESAFAEIVSRHINLVYSVAWRQVRDAHLAEEITQAVFIILARKAKSMDEKTILGGWLCRTARYASANALTVQRRRQFREQEAFMQNTLNEPATESELQATWSQIAPLLDTALGKLGGQDHDALVLRFFENKSFAEVGAALAVSESAAKMRVSRALEKLRKFFLKNGVRSTAAVLAGVLSVHSVQAAPAALAGTVTAIAAAKGVAASGSTLTFMKGTLKIMAWTKMKMAATVGAGVLLAASGGTVLYELNQPSAGEAVATGGANAPAVLKLDWQEGRRYSVVVEVDQSTETAVPGQPQPIKSTTHLKQNLDLATLQKLPDHSWDLQMKVTEAALDIRQNGAQVMSFDTAQNSPADPNNPASSLALVIGVPLQCHIDAGGDAQKVTGLEDLMKRLDAARPEAQMLFRQLFAEDTLKQYVSFGSSLPDHPARIGETWAGIKDIPSVTGTLTLNRKFTFMNWEQRGDRHCAHVKFTGRISSKSVSTASGAAIQVEKGELAGNYWFDPDLGMAVEVDSTQSITLKVSTQAQTVQPKMTQKTQWTLVGVQ